MLAQGVSDTFSLVQTGGVVAVLLVIIWTGVRGSWVFGREFKAMEERLAKTEEECKTYRELAIRSTNASEKVAELAKDHDGIDVARLFEDARRQGLL